MRILAIRGRNIASLAGEFVVDFRREPLASAGLFAICGATGSGKSTLLDVLCLALYDATPRLNKAKGQGAALPDVPNETLTPQDPRNLLRRGTAEGSAEVDFVGNDTREYRARWSVRRARGKADGRLQPQEMSLRLLPGDTPVGGSLKKEVLVAIEERLGLGFDQFVRAVLLAQNEFTAFLHANDNDRAQLLEMLTGTEQFSDLSIRAFQRSKAEQDTLRSLEQRLGDVQPLGADGRHAAEQDAEAAAADAEQTASAVHQLDEHLRWHAELADATAAETEARVARDAADFAWTEAGARQTTLALVEGVQVARPLVLDADRAATNLAEHRDQLMPEATHQAEACLAILQEAEVAERAAKAEATDAATHAAQTTPALTQARALDTQIAGLHTQSTRAAADTRETGAAATAARGRLDTAVQARNAAGAEREAYATWLAAHEAWQPLADGWDRWDTLLTQAGEHHANAARARVELGDALQAAGLRQEQAAAASEALGATREHADVAGRALGDAEVALATFDAAGLSAERDALETRANLLLASQQAHARLIDLRERAAIVEHAASDQATQAEESERQAAALDTERQLAEAAREQAQRAHDDVKAAAAKKIVELRGTLETHRPCPVCGSLEHPYASADHAVGDALTVLKTQLKTATQRAQALTEELGAKRATALQSAARADELRAELRELVAAARAAEDTWRANQVAAEVAALAPDACQAWFSIELARVETSRRALADTEARYRAAASRRDACLRDRDVTGARLREAERTERDAHLALSESTAAVTHARATLAQADSARDVALGRLNEAFPDTGWRTDWLAAPDAFRDTLAARAADYRNRVRGMHDAADRAGKLEASLAGLDDAARGAGLRADQAAAAEAALRQQLADAEGARAALLGGRAADDVARELDEQVARTRARVETRAQAANLARTAAAAASARLDDARRALDGATGADERATAALDQWLAGSWVPASAGTGGRPAEAGRHDDTAERHGDTAGRHEDDHLDWPSASSWVPASAGTGVRPAKAGRHEGTAPLDAGALRELLARDEGWIADERTALRRLEQTKTHARAVHDERRSRLAAIEARRATDEPADALAARRATLASALDAARARQVTCAAALQQDDEKRRAWAGLTTELGRQQKVTDVWARLSALIGSADGKRFRNYAQQLSLDVLLRYASLHLGDLSRRYRLRRIDATLGLSIVDRDMGDDVRSVHSLSGGESFLVSLALALGLASLSANRVRVESLFIDEGFGSLDADTLSVAIDALDRLHAQGCKVGVISHVQELAGRIGTRIVVERQSVGRSRVEVRR